MKKVWTKEKIDYLILIYKDKSNQEITDLINKRFNTNFTKLSINSKKTKMGLISNYKYKPKYTQKIRDYIKNNYIGKSNIELAKEVSKKFKIEVDNNSIQNIKVKIRLADGFKFVPARNDGCIKKGNKPFNKGKKWDEFMSKKGQTKSLKTTFKKGGRPQNYKPIGSERITVDGYIEVKISDLNKWETKNRVVWKKYYGEIPKDCKVIYLDKNRLNNDISNLALVSNRQELILNNKKLLFDNQELSRTGINIAKVLDKTYEKR